MLPTSHFSHLVPALPMDGDRLRPAPAKDAADALAGAFAEFIAVSSRLEISYRELQKEVAQLDAELAARNAALERSLRENVSMQQALAAIVDSMPCGVLVLGAGEHVLRINPEARRLLSLPAGEAVPTSLAELSRLSAVDLHTVCAMEHESEIEVAEFHAAGKPGQLWLQVRVRRLAGEPSAAQAILTLTDITGRKDAERDREAGRRALALAEVAATLAHEIRNPLTSLELFVSLLEDEPSRSEEWLAHLRAGLRGVSGIVNNVLSFHGTGFPLIRPLQLSCAVAVAAEFVRPLTVEAGLQLTLTGEHLPGTVMASESALQQIMLNLVMNAVRHTPAGGTVSIALEEACPGRLRLEIADTGCGIAPEHLPEIFRPGWSEDGARSGLGLNVCQRLAAQHGTEITVASTPGHGTAFSMELPLL